jgi:predicted outer membrane repeat protein
VLVLVDLLGGDFVAQDAAKEAVGIGHDEFTFCGNDSTGGGALSAARASWELASARLEVLGLGLGLGLRSDA